MPESCKAYLDLAPSQLRPLQERCTAHCLSLQKLNVGEALCPHHMQIVQMYISLKLLAMGRYKGEGKEDGHRGTDREQVS